MKDILIGDRIDISKGVGQYILPNWEDEISKNQNLHKRQILEHFFTNIDGRVTAIRGTMPSGLSAALTARFSRAQEFDIPELFWKEFVQGKNLGIDFQTLSSVGNGDIEKLLSNEKASNMIRKILDEFGDDSVREQASGYVMVKGASVLTSIQAFGHPLIKGIEASTRYIDWGSLSEEEFCIMPVEISQSAEALQIYKEAMNEARSAYKILWPQVWDFIVRANPQKEDQSDVAYKNAIKGATCDALRGLLPLGVRTNFGIHADYRSLTETIMNLRASPLAETRQIADEMAAELVKVNKEFVGVVQGEHGRKWTEYEKEEKRLIHNFIDISDRTEVPTPHLGVSAVILNADWQKDLLAGLILSENPGTTEENLGQLVKQCLMEDKLTNYLKQLGAVRTNRRHKLPTLFENVAVLVRIENLSLGAWKDLNRQRKLLSKSRSDMNGDRGFVVPKEIEVIGGAVKEIYSTTMRNLLIAKHKLEQKYPDESKLLLPHGARTSVYMAMGLGEFFWITELRSIASGNSEYRQIAIELYKSLLKQAPLLANLGSFVDQNEYTLGRITEAVKADLKGK